MNFQKFESILKKIVFAIKYFKVIIQFSLSFASYSFGKKKV